MSWRDNKKRGGGYSRGRGYRQNRGGRNAQHNSDKQTEDGDSGQRQFSGNRGGGGYRGRPYKRSQANHSYESKRPRYAVGQRLKEDDIGVTEFVGSHKRFAGLVKERFGDFHVHEISCDGEICKLTNQTIPPAPQDLKDMNDLKKSIPPDVNDKLEDFVNPNTEISTLEIDVTELDKDIRRNIHTIAKKVPYVISETIERDNKKIILLAKKNKQTSHKFRGDSRIDWSSREGNYCHFLLHKVNMDTMDALNQLALRLHIKPDIFHYAGTKDRRARTTQWVSLKKVSPMKIHVAAKQVRGAHVGNFKFAKEPLRLGLLNGNRFRIALRSVNANDDEIETAVNSLRDNGFINYYGLQRFGTIAAIPTHDIGKALLQGKWNEAIDLILKPRAGEQQKEMIEAREIYQKTKNAKDALRPIANSGKIEAKLLNGIAISGANNPQGALDHIPRNARLMYIHSYQSLVWNKIVSRRFREFGSKPIVGDLVYENVDDAKNIVKPETMDYAAQNDEDKGEKMEKSEEIEKEEEEMKVEEDEDKESVNESKEEKNGDEENLSKEDSDVPVEDISEMTVSNTKDKEQETENDNLDESTLPAVKALTEEDLSNYTLADVVMPKPGWKVTYPVYAKPWFDELLAKDELTTDLRQKNMKYSLGGAYRKILEKPGDLSWRIARYNGYHDDLILCDVDEMRGVELSKQEPDGKYKALILEFSLSSSTYATMALREILEHDTSAQSQAAQSAANQEQERKEEEAKKIEIDGSAADDKIESEDAENKKSTDLNAEDVKTEGKETAQSSANQEEDRKEEDANKMETSQSSANQEEDRKEEDANKMETAQSSANQEQDRKKENANKMEIDGGAVEDKIEPKKSENKNSTDVIAEDTKMEVKQIAQSEKLKDSINGEEETAEEKMEVADDGVNIPEVKDEPKKKEESTEKS